MELQENISSQWLIHESKPFPAGCRNKKIADTNLTLLESDIAANILTFINTNGKLVGRRRAELECQVELLTDSILDLTEEARSYFDELREIASIVLTNSND
ncbi:MAG: hypothetical protein KDD56_02075 [Bdellovibrionales bacterium]|nr:hypothetical protein [Bdellovibrionales bacterium]